MAAELVEGAFGPHAPEGLADNLRKLADAVDQGEVTGVVYACSWKNAYEISMSGSSIQEDLVLATLLHNKAVRQFYL